MPVLLRLRFGLLLLTPTLVHAATLENPADGSFYSGIGVVSGWKCTANGSLTVRFNDGDAIPLAYENERGDTAGVCGDTNNGFVAIMNWAILGDGTHTAVVYDNGIEFARSTFTVATFGTEFLKGAGGYCDKTAYPDYGTDLRFIWNEATQHMELQRIVKAVRDRGTATFSCNESDARCFSYNYYTSRSLYLYNYDTLYEYCIAQGGQILDPSRTCPPGPTCVVEPEDINLPKEISATFYDLPISEVQNICTEAGGHFWNHFAGEDGARGEPGPMMLENPASGLHYSGIGVISGWKCEVRGPLTVSINGSEPIPLAYGLERSDTREICGDTSNGFVAQVNYAIFASTGQGIAEVREGGEVIWSSTFTMGSVPGEETIGEPHWSCNVVGGFGAPGARARFRWNPATQHMELQSSYLSRRSHGADVPDVGDVPDAAHLIQWTRQTSGIYNAPPVEWLGARLVGRLDSYTDEDWYALQVSEPSTLPLDLGEENEISLSLYKLVDHSLENVVEWKNDELAKALLGDNGITRSYRVSPGWHFILVRPHPPREHFRERRESPKYTLEVAVWNAEEKEHLQNSCRPGRRENTGPYYCQGPIREKPCWETPEGCGGGGGGGTVDCNNAWTGSEGDFQVISHCLAACAAAQAGDTQGRDANCSILRTYERHYPGTVLRYCPVCQQ